MKMILLVGAALTLAACYTAPQPYYGSAYEPYDTYYGSYHSSAVYAPYGYYGSYYGSTAFPYPGAPLTAPNPNVR